MLDGVYPRGTNTVMLIAKPDADKPFENYRKKPVCVKAKQMEYLFEIETLEGKMSGKPGDWLIEGVAGGWYPCANEIFKKTYEKVEE